MSLELIVAIAIGVPTVLLMWQQNRILQKQNEIFSRQEGVDMGSSVTNKYRKYWPMLAMGVLMLFTWLAVGYDFYHRSNRGTQPILEFDSPHDIGMYDWGMDSPNSCDADVDETAFESYRNDYKITLGCFDYDGTVDPLDSPNMQVGNLYDINPGRTHLRVTWGETYNQYRVQHHFQGIHIALLLVPNGIQPSQFTTLRQARALGVHIPHISSAIPRLSPRPAVTQ